ncbi:GtrA family protein [Paenibacillus koleovorans]|uniref:GtrA family protein n=1 Tax=Paenibacillus koleovorans TaxID=121608 RepID=UPI000FD74C02|nr:GtrA family protein [Paenibacillus koleovorans]
MNARLQAYWNHSFVRFLFVGVLNTLVGLSAAYAFLNLAGFNYWVSTFLGNTIGAIVSYWLNKKFTFKSDVSVGRSAWKFVLVILVCYFGSYQLGIMLSHWGLGLIGVEGSKWAENVAILIGNGVYTITNYLGHRFFTFRVPGGPVLRAGGGES